MGIILLGGLVVPWGERNEDGGREVGVWMGFRLGEQCKKEEWSSESEDEGSSGTMDPSSPAHKRSLAFLVLPCPSSSPMQGERQRHLS